MYNIPQNTKTELANQLAEYVTLTQFGSFQLSKSAGQQAIVQQSLTKPEFEPHWNPVRNAIKKGHQSSMTPTAVDLAKIIGSYGAWLKYPSRHADYLEAVSNYSTILNDNGIQGTKGRLKDYEAVANIGEQLIKIKPDVVLKGDDGTYVVKLHINKKLPMTSSVASQVCSIMSNEFGHANNEKYLVIDVLGVELFTATGAVDYSLEQATMGGQLFQQIKMKLIGMAA